MPSLSQPNPIRGMVWMIVSGLCVIAVSSLVKYTSTSAEYPPAQLAFVRYAWGVFLVLPVLPHVLRLRPTPREHMYLFGRGFFQFAGVIGWFYALAHIPLADATAINYMQPIFATLLAALILGERFAMRRMIAICVALVGAAIILRPGFRDVHLGHWAMLFGAFVFALGSLAGKKASETMPAEAIVFYLTMYVSLGLLIPALWTWVPMSYEAIGVLAIVAVFATGAHYAMAKAFSYAPLSVTQPMTFLQLVWSVVIGLVIFHEGVDLWVIGGASLIMAASGYIAYREAQLKRG